MYALIDCNNFYVSCERVFQPQFNGRPVVVLSNNDGCIISRSEEAKALGIDMAQPEFKIRKELRQFNVKVFSSNYSLYGDLSERVFAVMNTFTPNVEKYSIDEAFLDFTGVAVADFDAYGMEMKETVLKWLSLPICVGVAPSKTLAKAANRIAKKYQEQTKGVYVIDTDEKRLKALKWLKIGDVWGIGYRTVKKLKAIGVQKAIDFIQPGMEQWIKKNMGVIGMRIKLELQGTPAIGSGEVPEEKKSIATTRSFPKQLTDYDLIRERVSTFATVTAEKLRRQNSCCHTIIVMLVADKHSIDIPKYHYSRALTLPYATNSALTISATAIQLLKQLMAATDTVKFKKAGVIVTELIPDNAKQFDLFVDEDPRHLKLMTAMDKVNQKMGTRIIRLGAQAEKTWDMKQNMRSPRYTTAFKDILTVQCR
ncbi:SOS mutagenesis and repair protein UmuC [Flavobacterium akiainvivens]|uniref:SOS mutagenesis and repair protein UmuC n=1 Tax=Flavobacterium akiainvivens TaxID=1202724 RepID=A0A0M8MJB5_9FLAO|nr:Y-family DNA polymerase [Flavobacterium akiainvivens]KOS07381.1 SOS mutagenesis and repair protein UmuC [Flavobacterium akiainvivens]SFQ47437.1 DNA polymerase V [Flavobacterium akiainvivens]